MSSGNATRSIWTQILRLVVVGILLWSAAVHAQGLQNMRSIEEETGMMDLQDTENTTSPFPGASPGCTLLIGLLHPDLFNTFLHDFLTYVLCTGYATSIVICITLFLSHHSGPVVALVIGKGIADCLSAMTFIAFPAMRSFLEDELPQGNFTVEHFSESIPGVFHVTSIWVTVTLAAQICLCAFYPSTVRVVSTAKNVLGVCLISFLSLLAYLYRWNLLTFIEEAYDIPYTQAVLPHSPATLPNTTATCSDLFSPEWMADNSGVFLVYNFFCFSFRSSVMTYCPCFALAVLAFTLLKIVRWEEGRTALLLQYNLHLEARATRKRSAANLTVLTIVTLTLTLETINSLVSTVVAWQLTFDVPVLSMGVVNAAWMLVDFSNAFSGPITLLLGMSLDGKHETQSKKCLQS